MRPAGDNPEPNRRSAYSHSSTRSGTSDNRIRLPSGSGYRASTFVTRHWHISDRPPLERVQSFRKLDRSCSVHPLPLEQLANNANRTPTHRAGRASAELIDELLRRE